MITKVDGVYDRCAGNSMKCSLMSLGPANKKLEYILNKLNFLLIVFNHFSL